ncbi:MAG: hypothetical protein IIA87_04665 [Nanoarchaeota archaeon]|nr:hypothetical protein [Nanoarchaeota archaeon]
MGDEFSLSPLIMIVPAGIGAIVLGIGAAILFERVKIWEDANLQSMREKMYQETGLYQMLSEVADTNAERIQIYEKHGLIIPLPNLTSEQIREYLVSHREDGER